MSEKLKQSLLPEGLHDELPPIADYRSTVVADLLGAFASAGYEQVAPPLLEFEDSLLTGSGVSQARHMFRLMDPASHRMMALRADMTLQIARIAATRLANAARPLRLSYAGPVLRVKGLQFRPERELIQAGIELIGSDAPAADLEVLLLAVETLGGLGVEGLSVDLTMPPLVPALCRAFGADDDQMRRARAALDAKDQTALPQVDGRLGELLGGLIEVTGRADDALEKLRALELPDEARALREQLYEHVRQIRNAAPDLALTIDLGDSRGFEYYTGIGFALFAPGAPSELGRGGRYQARRDGGAGETAAGFTVYVDSLLRALPGGKEHKRLYVPHGTPWPAVRKLAHEGWRTVQGLEPEADVVSEAKRLGCTHILASDGTRAVEEQTTSLDMKGISDGD
ncbi:MAG: ATP phosphoribosyltransferase regulatory subunit [Sphingomonadales bacterium]